MFSLNHPLDIPDYLVTQIKEGKVVLVLGSGCSLSAKNSKGNSPPTTLKLAKMLSDQFLGGKFKNLTLNQIGEYAITTSDLFTYIFLIAHP